MDDFIHGMDRGRDDFRVRGARAGFVRSFSARGPLGLPAPANHLTIIHAMDEIIYGMDEVISDRMISAIIHKPSMVLKRPTSQSSDAPPGGKGIS
jgi:hypothetical protein